MLHSQLTSALLIAIVCQELGFRAEHTTDSADAQLRLGSARQTAKPFRVLIVDVEVPQIELLRPEKNEAVIVLQPDATTRPAVVDGWAVSGVMIGPPSPQMIAYQLSLVRFRCSGNWTP